MKYFSLFGYSKPVIGMLHLKKDSSMGMLERAQRETLCYLNSGVEAILVENYFGSTLDCEIVLQWLQRERSEAIYGVNILGNMGESFRLCQKYDARFIQIDSVCGHLNPIADATFVFALIELRQNFDGVVLGGVRFKYQPVLSGRTIEQNLLLGMERCDAIVVTGDGTGRATPVKKVRDFRRIIEHFPLVIGAGVTQDTISETESLCDGKFVGSYFKTNQRDIGDVEPEFVQAFMTKKHQCETMFRKD